MSSLLLIRQLRPRLNTRLGSTILIKPLSTSKVKNKIQNFQLQAKRVVTWFGSTGLIFVGSLLLITVGSTLYNELTKRNYDQPLTLTIDLLKQDTRIAKYFGDNFKIFAYTFYGKKKKYAIRPKVYTVKDKTYIKLDYFLEDEENRYLGKVSATSTRDDTDLKWNIINLDVKIQEGGNEVDRIDVLSRLPKLFSWFHTNK